MRNPPQALDRAVALGCNFFDTAWAYGDGHSERLLGELLRRHPDNVCIAATKVPPKNRRGREGRDAGADDVFPYDHIVDYTERVWRTSASSDRSAAAARLGRRWAMTTGGSARSRT